MAQDTNRVELVCTACTIERRGIRTRKAPEHTCLKGDKNYIPPADKIIGLNTYVEFYVTKAIYDTGKATRWQCCVQIANGQKVKSGTELWIPNHLYHNSMDTVHPKRGKKLWVEKDFYIHMVFLP